MRLNGKSRVKQIRRVIITVAVATLLPVSTLSGIDPKDTRLLAQPALSENHIAFTYAHDLWVADADGSYRREITGTASNYFVDMGGCRVVDWVHAKVSQSHCRGLCPSYHAARE